MKRLSIALAALAASALAPASADSVVRLEYVIVNEGPGLAGGGSGTVNLLAAEPAGGSWVYTVTAGSPLTGASAITPPVGIVTNSSSGYGRPHVRVSVISGSVAVLTDSTLTAPTAGMGRVVIAGDDHFVSLRPGDKISIIDLPAATSNKNNGLTDFQLRASPVPVTQASAATGGRHVVSAAGTNAASGRSGAGRVAGWCFGNTTASWRFVKLHDTAITPTAGAGVARTIPIPPNGPNCVLGSAGIAFSTGIGLTITGGAADADATAVAANDVVASLFSPFSRACWRWSPRHRPSPRPSASITCAPRPAATARSSAPSIRRSTAPA